MEKNNHAPNIVHSKFHKQLCVFILLWKGSIDKYTYIRLCETHNVTFTVIVYTVYIYTFGVSQELVVHRRLVGSVWKSQNGGEICIMYMWWMRGVAWLRGKSKWLFDAVYLLNRFAFYSVGQPADTHIALAVVTKSGLLPFLYKMHLDDDVVVERKTVYAVGGIWNRGTTKKQNCGFGWFCAFVRLCVRAWPNRAYVVPILLSNHDILSSPWWLLNLSKHVLSMTYGHGLVVNTWFTNAKLWIGENATANAPEPFQSLFVIGFFVYTLNSYFAASSLDTKPLCCSAIKALYQ